MRAITKGPAPQSLIAHCQNPPCDYDNYQDKDSLREALVAEQRGLGCYCMGRIGPDSTAMKIEHWRCRANYPEEQLNYDNLLGACLGGEGKPGKLQHCDTRKGDADLCLNPANPNHAIEARVQYLFGGTIESDDEEFNGQLNDVLNLNLDFLKSNRKVVLDSVLYWWREQQKPVPRWRIERKREKYDPANGILSPYCQVAVWWLDEKLSEMAQRR